MKRIVRVHHPSIDEALVEQALSAFYRLRQNDRLRKRPSTSELIDWLLVLARSGVAGERVVRELPFLGVLLKKEQDHELMRGGYRN
jgi:MoxR-like ATPase